MQNPSPRGRAVELSVVLNFITATNLGRLSEENPVLLRHSP